MISTTSTLYIQRGGRLYCANTLVNKNQIICEGDLQLDVGLMKQVQEALIINKGDLLVNLREQQDSLWFGNVLVHHHFFLQLQKKVSVDAHIVCQRCDVEFFGKDSQLVVHGTWIADVGVLNLEADGDASSGEIPNLVMVGQLFTKGVDGITASFETKPGAICILTESLDPGINEVNISVRWLKIQSESVISCTGAPLNANKPNTENLIKSTTVNVNCQEEFAMDGQLLSTTVNVNCQEELAIHGELRIADSDYSNIQAQSLKNTGHVLCIENDTFDKNRKTKTKPSMLKIKSDQNIFNSGLIKCDGNINVQCDSILNKNGIINATPDLVINLSTQDETAVEGTLIVDGLFNVESSSEKKLIFSAIGGSIKNKRNEESGKTINSTSDGIEENEVFSNTPTTSENATNATGDSSNGIFWLPQTFYYCYPQSH